MPDGPAARPMGSEDSRWPGWAAAHPGPGTTRAHLLLLVVPLAFSGLFPPPPPPWRHGQPALDVSSATVREEVGAEGGCGDLANIAFTCVPKALRPLRTRRNVRKAPLRPSPPAPAPPTATWLLPLPSSAPPHPVPSGVSVQSAITRLSCPRPPGDPRAPVSPASTHSSPSATQPDLCPRAASPEARAQAPRLHRALSPRQRVPASLTGAAGHRRRFLPGWVRVRNEELVPVDGLPRGGAGRAAWLHKHGCALRAREVRGGCAVGVKGRGRGGTANSAPGGGEGMPAGVPCCGVVVVLGPESQFWGWSRLLVFEDRCPERDGGHVGCALG